MSQCVPFPVLEGGKLELALIITALSPAT